MPGRVQHDRCATELQIAAIRRLCTNSEIMRPDRHRCAAEAASGVHVVAAQQAPHKKHMHAAPYRCHHCSIHVGMILRDHT